MAYKNKEDRNKNARKNYLLNIDKKRKYNREWNQRQNPLKKKLEYLKTKVEKDCKICGVKIFGVKKKKYCDSCRFKVQSDFSKGNQHYKLVKNRLYGEKHHNWKGGSSFLKKKIWDSLKYKQWRKECMVRDNYTCQECWVRGKVLEVHHHKINFSQLLIKFNIKSKEEADNCKELWELDLGITLCNNCHNKTKNGRPKK